jgi:hypothetical protein
MYICPCFPLAGGSCKFYANAGGKRPIQRQPVSVKYCTLYKQQDNPLLSMHNYTPLVISGDDKNKQLTLSTQTCINWKKYVNSSVNSEERDAYSGLNLSIYVIKSPIQLVRQSHENLYENLPLCSVGAALYILYCSIRLN